MKTKVIYFVCFFLFVAIISKGQPLRVESNGDIEFNVGWTGIQLENADGGAGYQTTFRPQQHWSGYIGLPNCYWKHIRSHQIWANGVLLQSDAKIKKNIVSLDHALEKITKLQGKKYDLDIEKISGKSADNIDASLINKSKNKFGFIAQDLKLVFPELVEYNENTDMHSIDYFGLIPILTEAIKEQQTQIEDLKAQINTCCNKNSLDATKSTQKSSSKGDIQETGAKLYQNTPNPFSDNTTISMLIPKEVTSATLYVYDMQGAQKKSIPVNSRGNTSVTISGGEFEAGMYMYTLIADGKEVDTKRMILTE